MAFCCRDHNFKASIAFSHFSLPWVTKSVRLKSEVSIFMA